MTVATPAEAVLEEGVADYRVTIPNIAGWLNSNDSHGGKLYFKRAALVDAWRKAGAWHAREAGLPHLERAHIYGQVCFPDNRERDPNNWYPTAKAAVDGFVDAGVLDDDSHRYLIGPDMRIGPRVTTSRTSPGGPRGLLVLHVFRLPPRTEAAP